MRRPGSILLSQLGTVFVSVTCSFALACAGCRRNTRDSAPRLAAPPLDAVVIAPTLNAPENFGAVYRAEKDRAITLVATMTEPQYVR